MLMAQVERYISLRQKLGYQLRELSGSLRAFAKFATDRSDTHVRRLDGGGLGRSGSFHPRSLYSAAKCRPSGSLPARRGSGPRGATQSVSHIYATTPPLHLLSRRRSCSLSERPVVFASPIHFDDKFTQPCSG